MIDGCTDSKSFNFAGQLVDLMLFESQAEKHSTNSGTISSDYEGVTTEKR